MSPPFPLSKLFENRKQFVIATFDSIVVVVIAVIKPPGGNLRRKINPQVEKQETRHSWAIILHLKVRHKTQTQTIGEFRVLANLRIWHKIRGKVAGYIWLYMQMQWGYIPWGQQ